MEQNTQNQQPDADEIFDQIKILLDDNFPLPLGVSKSSLDSAIVVTDDDIEAIRSPEISIGESDLLKPIKIIEPQDEAQTVTLSIDLKGECEANVEIKLECNEYQSSTNSNANGEFVFTEVPLIIGWNDVEIQLSKYPSISTIIQVFRQERPILFVGLKDPYSQSTLSENDEVVRCKRCKTFARLDSWNALPGCAKHGCGNRQYWTRDDNEYFLEDDEIEL